MDPEQKPEPEQGQNQEPKQDQKQGPAQSQKPEATGSAAPLSAPIAEQLAAQLAQFDRDPKAALSTLPPKEDLQNPSQRAAGTAFRADSLSENAFIDQRDRYRKLLNTERDGQLIRLGQVQPGRAPYQQNDRVENLVDGSPDELLRTLEAMEELGLRSARLPESPWSDWYWPIYQGILGARYNDPGFPLDSEDWKVKRDYVLARSAPAIVDGGNAEAINRLSPSEKYDQLIGDRDGQLTSAMWEEGERYYDQQGQVERWMGICHGWSPAAYMLDRPRHAIELVAADGKTKLLFYPADLKALGSLLWAKASPAVRFIGGRCNDKSPATDENGRVRSALCFDTNPGTFHMALVNQIGLRKRSFIIDATFDYEVWNQPVHSYSYTYWNPLTRQPAASLAEAKVERSALTNDRFAKYRSADARYFVGIGVKLAYVAETVPDDSEEDSAERDALKTVRYVYDLELDEDGVILGGEWYNNAHPDFLWTPPPAVMAQATTDYAATGEWTGGVLPESWRRAAIAAARNGQPLGKLVAALMKLAAAPGR